MAAVPTLAADFKPGYAIACQQYVAAARRLNHGYACAAHLSQQHGIHFRTPGLIAKPEAGLPTKRNEAAVARTLPDPSWIADESGFRDRLGDAQFSKQVVDVRMERFPW